MGCCGAKTRASSTAYLSATPCHESDPPEKTTSFGSSAKSDSSERSGHKSPRSNRASSVSYRQGGQFMDVYLVGEMLGEGAFGSVYGCTLRERQQEFAVKMVDKVETPVERIRMEAQMLQRMSHSNVVKFHQVFYEKCFVCIIMDKHPGGDILAGMKAHQKSGVRVKDRSFIHVSRQMAASLQYIHSQFIVHRDIKGDNFLLDRKDMADPQCVVTLCDFGLATQIQEGRRLHDVCGTRLFWPPEFYDGDYGPKVDIWAMGVVTYALLCGSYPFRSEEDVRTKEVTLPKHTSPSCVDYVHRMLERDEDSRLSSNEVVQHGWVTDSTVSTQPHLLSTSRESLDALDGCDLEDLHEHGAKAGVAERRHELLERLEHTYVAADTRLKSIRSGKSGQDLVQVFNPRFTVFDRRAGPGAIFEWWSVEQCNAKGLINPDVSAALLVEEEVRDDDSGIVRHMLEDHGISVECFGKGESKTLGEVASEVQRGACRMMLDATAHKKLVRVVDVVVLRIRVTGKTEKFLVEMAEQFPDGRKRQANRLPGTKKEPAENTRKVAQRIMEEKLNMSDGDVEFDFSSKEVFEEENESPSYPGLMTVYRKEIIEGQVSTDNPAVLRQIGLPSGGGWNYEDPHGNRKFFIWLTEKQCEGRNVTLRAPVEGEEVSGLVPAPVGLNEDDLRDYLEKSGVDTASFGSDYSKSMAHFSDELMRGESILMRGPNMRIVRVVDVVLMTLVRTDSGAILVQTAQVHPDGHTVTVNRLPGAKRRPDENHFLAAWRLLMKNLRMDENQVDLDSSDVKIIDEEQNSPSYPGLRTVYRKRVITADVRPYSLYNRAI